MKDQKVIAFVGMPGAGKGTCTKYLNEKYDYPVIHFGDMVYEEVQRRGLDNVVDERFVREDMRKQEGAAVLAKRVAEKVDDLISQGKKYLVLDGLYSWSEYKYLKAKYGESLVVIAIAASRALRHQRVVQRQDTHRAYTEEQIKIREIDEIETLEKGGPIAIADYTLLNNDSPENLLKNLEETMAQIGDL